jgi:hypothetical protein
MTLQHFTRYLEAYMIANTDLPTHDLADNNPTYLPSNPTNLLQPPTKLHSTPTLNPFPTIAFPTLMIPILTHQHTFNHPPTLQTIPTITHHLRHRNHQPKNNYANYDQYELVNDGSDFDNYALIVDDTWSIPVLPCYH